MEALHVSHDRSHERLVRKMLKMWRILSGDFGVFGDRILYGILMKGLLTNYESAAAEVMAGVDHLSMIEALWSEMVCGKGIAPDYKNFHFLSRCQVRMVERAVARGEAEAVRLSVNKLMHDIPSERVRHGLKPNDHILARYQLQAHVLAYYDSDSNRVERLFEALRANNKIGVSLMQQTDETLTVDLSDCEYANEVQFFVRYLLRHSAALLRGKDLVAIVGKMQECDEEAGHTKYRRQQMEHARRLKVFLAEFVQRALGSDIELEFVGDNIVKIDKSLVERLVGCE